MGFWRGQQCERRLTPGCFGLALVPAVEAIVVAGFRDAEEPADLFHRATLPSSKKQKREADPAAKTEVTRTTSSCQKSFKNNVPLDTCN